ncbi:unnamed protein product [Candida verbasci]|uniref:Bromo domain-containing protein n=1 Tax=Candida verbasci TaxID=1227364 RepID=A0A9W4TSZ8_9ASCO|nr:unnamed protein product [Candida verbasci]
MPPKRKTTTNLQSPNKKIKTENDLKDFFTSSINLLLNLTDQGESVASAFIKLPSKKLYPDYYDIIKQPISLNEIQKKIRTEKNYDLSDFISDFELLLKNAATYNDEDSWIVANARQLVDFVKDQVKEYETIQPKLKLTVKEPEEFTYGKLPEICKNILEDVMNHEFEEGILSGPFLEEVDQSIYTDYSVYVSKPMAFNTIISNLERKKLFTPKVSLLENFEKFRQITLLIFSNAKAYNNEDSQIYQDANLLESYFNEKFNEWKSKIDRPKIKLNLKPKKEVEEEKIEIKEEPNEVPIISEKSHLNTMGRSSPTLPKENSIIQESSIFSSPQITQEISKYVQQKASNFTLMSRDQEIRSNLFPTHKQRAIATLFSYKIPANGFTSQSYTIALPSESSPFISFKVSLHNLLYQAKKRDLVDGHGNLNSTSDDDFQCKLYVNDEEVSYGPEIFEEGKVLGVQYDVKLSYGLNVLNFECKVAPNLSKKIKHTILEENEEMSGSRHTRHQLQQMKMTWDVENITFYVVCNNN